MATNPASPSAGSRASAAPTPSFSTNFATTRSWPSRVIMLTARSICAKSALRGVVVGRRHQPGEFEVSKAEEHGIEKHVCHDAEEVGRARNLGDARPGR